MLFRIVILDKENNKIEKQTVGDFDMAIHLYYVWKDALKLEETLILSVADPNFQILDYIILSRFRK